MIRVYENQLEKALRAFKRQMAKEGILKEVKRRSFYEKPSVKKKRKQKEAHKKRVKAARAVSFSPFGF
ncbi:MAG: 30S ribosomal protein S21 [Nitrospirota bacterium]